MSSPFVFIIDTDAYAGNFERELCAYCTGQVGECGVGQELADQFQAEFPEEHDAFAAIVASVPDERGCHRPVEIWPTPGRFNDGYGNCYDDHADPDVVSAAYAEAVRKRYAENLARIEAQSFAVSAVRDLALQRVNEDFADALLKGYTRHPVYESVDIHFAQRPTPKQIAFMQRRAREYATRPSCEWVAPFRIKGFALERIITTKEREELSDGSD